MGEMSITMFPTGVGMNRRAVMALNVLRYVPHRRGDEPGREADIGLERLCSPQAWG